MSMIGSVERSITLELSDTGVQERIAARQGDSLIHRINISLTSEGVPYRLKDVYTASVWAILPDGSAVTADCEIRDNRCVFVPGGGFFEAGGPVMCRLVLRGMDGAELFSPAFAIDAEGDAYGGMKMAAAKEYSKIGEILLQVLDIKRQCEELVTVGGNTAGEVYEAGEDDYFTLYSLDGGTYVRYTWESLKENIGRYLEGRVYAAGVADPVTGYSATPTELSGDTTLLTEEDAKRFVSLDGGEVHETVERAVDEWLDGHPEATTSVQDGSISPEKTTFITCRDTGEGAVTEIIPKFTNLADPASEDWLDGYNFNAKAITTLSGSIVTNFIQCTGGDVIRIKGLNVDKSKDRTLAPLKYARYTSTDGTTATSAAAYLLRTYTEMNNQTGVYNLLDKDELEAGIACIVVGQSFANAEAEANGTVTQGGTTCTRIRVAGTPTGDVSDIIITVNEPIAYDVVTSGGLMEYVLDPDIVVPAARELGERLEDIGERLDSHDALISGGSDAVVPEIVMPHELAVAVGVECNIFKENIVFSSRPLDNYSIRATLISSNGAEVKNYPDFFRITAAEGQEGDYTFTVRIHDRLTNAVVLEKSAVMHIVPNTDYTASPKNVLFIGDSVTASYRGTLMAEIQYNLSGGGIVSIGTQTGTANDYGYAGNVQHEGHNGATARISSSSWGNVPIGFSCRHITRTDMENGVVSPFWNPDTESFDLGYYLSSNGFAKPDAVCINLGLNSLSTHSHAKTGLMELVTKIREYDSDLPIIISMCTQLATGPEAKTNITDNRKQWRNLQQTSVLEQFDGGKVPGVYISTPYMALDMSGDYKVSDEQRSARDTETIKVVKDYYHPEKKGLLKLADAYYPWILYALGNK